jgi:hypothetical protein
LGEAPVALPHAEPMSLAARLRAGKLAVKEKRKHFSAVAESDTFLEDPGAWEKAQERLESTHQWVRGELDDVPLTPGLVCSPRKRSSALVAASACTSAPSPPHRPSCTHVLGWPHA